MIEIDRIDHLVLTVASIEKTVQFYQRALAMDVEVFAQGRTALRFGNQKINLHEVGSEFEPKANCPTPGSGDICLITQTPMKMVLAHLALNDIAVEAGPVSRTGATGALVSVYFRDPDGNLIEVSNLE